MIEVFDVDKMVTQIRQCIQAGTSYVHRTMETDTHMNIKQVAMCDLQLKPNEWKREFFLHLEIV